MALVIPTPTPEWPRRGGDNSGTKPLPGQVRAPFLYDFESSHHTFATHQVAMEVQIARVLVPWTKMLEVIKEE